MASVKSVSESANKVDDPNELWERGQTREPAGTIQRKPTPGEYVDADLLTAENSRQAISEGSGGP